MHEARRLEIVRDEQGLLKDFPWVRTALWATIPSGDPTLVQLRARLSILMPGKPFSLVGAECKVTPRVVHCAVWEDLVDDVVTFVG